MDMHAALSLGLPLGIAMPRGGRPLVIAKSIPAARSRATASQARAVRTLSSVTSVPSTSHTSSLIGFICASALSSRAPASSRPTVSSGATVSSRPRC